MKKSLNVMFAINLIFKNEEKERNFCAITYNHG
mgnify:CR=1 FL=1